MRGPGNRLEAAQLKLLAFFCLHSNPPKSKIPSFSIIKKIKLNFEINNNYINIFKKKIIRKIKDLFF
jgi:hypothetical protein